MSGPLRGSAAEGFGLGEGSGWIARPVMPCLARLPPRRFTVLGCYAARGKVGRWQLATSRFSNGLAAAIASG
jgi:hypothetical protein